MLAFLWSALPPVEPEPPRELPPSRVFRDTGVAILNTTLLDAGDNVQLRFKSSPFGRQSHGHDPHNSFTLNAYGEALLVNNVYRDWHGSPFHTGWTWSTRAQNALLVNGEGQKRPSPEPLGRIQHWDFQEGADYVAGEAAAAYDGRLKSYVRHVIFVKPDVLVIADDVEATAPSTFQWMLHGSVPFQLEPEHQVLVLEKPKACVRVHYVAPHPLQFRQWTGYDPPTDLEYLKARGSDDFPPQWHVEASLPEAVESARVLTVLRPHRRGVQLVPHLEVSRTETVLLVQVSSADGQQVRVALRQPGARVGIVEGTEFTSFAWVSKGTRQWRF